MNLEYDKEKDIWRGILDLTGTTQMYLGVGADSTRYKTAVAHNKEMYNKFRETVENTMKEILRVSPAGSQSFELSKNFLENNYGIGNA